MELFRGDYRNVLADKTADLILTSPPYNIGSKSIAKTGRRKFGEYDPKSYRGIREYADTRPEKSYQKSQLEFMRWSGEHLKRNGILAYNHKPRRVNGRMIHPMEWMTKVDNLELMEEIIWDRGSTHNHCLQMVWQCTERIYIFKRVGDKYLFRNSGRMMFRGDIWKINRAPTNGHNAPFPLLLAEEIIQAWSQVGGTVMDPYLGSGTTAIAAIENGRGFVGSEKLAKYFNQAQRRVDEWRSQNLMAS